MSWESTGDFKTLDDIVAYGNARAEAERERILQELTIHREALLVYVDIDWHPGNSHEQDLFMGRAATVSDCMILIDVWKGIVDD
jgi:hypothetical protein